MTVEVVPAGGGEQWEVRVVGVPLRRFRRKQDAKNAARRVAKRRGMQLQIRRANGTYQTSRYTQAEQWG